MSQLLTIRSSATGAQSVSNLLVDRLLSRLREQDPQLDVVERDLDTTPVPALRSDTIVALGREDTDTEASASASARALSDALIAEIRAADMIVIGAPMYNFGMPAVLKAWFDLVLRAGETFTYGENGPVGLIADKPVFVIETSGGIYSEGPAAGMDFREPHIRTLLGFVGLRQVEFIRAEGLALGDAEAVIAAVGEVIDTRFAPVLESAA